MKKITVLFLFSFLLANETIIKNLIGEYKFETFKGLLTPIIENEDIKENIQFLLNNGLLTLKTNSSPHPTFLFKTTAPLFDTKLLYSSLKRLGYYSFYPTHIKKDINYSITLYVDSPTLINPLSLINEMEKRGCEIINIEKKENFQYTFNCENRFLQSIILKNRFKKIVNAKGIYFIDPNGFSKIIIKTSRFDRWYPYVVFYNKNLKIINIINMDAPTTNLLLDIPPECKYIKITDNYTKENFKRGIWIKGLQ